MKKTIQIKDATPKQLRDFGTIVYGMELNGRENRGQMLNKLEEVGFVGGSIDIEVEDAGADVLRPGMAGAEVVGAEKVNITIHTVEGPGGDEPVKVSVNGSAMLIPRGKPVDIPKPYFNVLSDAKQSIPIVNRDGAIEGYRDRHAYPFSRN